jgi:hypothetical protein
MECNVIQVFEIIIDFARIVTVSITHSFHLRVTIHHKELADEILVISIQFYQGMK